VNARAHIFLLVAWFDLSMILMASDFGTVVASGGSPITPDQYGAAIYAIPALVWAAVQLGGAAAGMAGAIAIAANTRFLRAAGFICGLGNVALAGLFLTFAVLSREAPQGLLLHSLSKFPGLMVSGGCAVIAWRLMIWGDED